MLLHSIVLFEAMTEPSEPIWVVQTYWTNISVLADLSREVAHVVNVSEVPGGVAPIICNGYVVESHSECCIRIQKLLEQRRYLPRVPVVDHLAIDADTIFPVKWTLRAV